MNQVHLFSFEDFTPFLLTACSMQSMTARKAIFCLRDRAVLGPLLTVADVITVLRADNGHLFAANTTDLLGDINLDVDISLLEFLEIVVGCALHLQAAPWRSRPHTDDSGVLAKADGDASTSTPSDLAQIVAIVKLCVS